jgi:hypothetical protein
MVEDSWIESRKLVRLETESETRKKPPEEGPAFG